MLKASAALGNSDENSYAKAERGRAAMLQYRAACGDMSAQYHLGVRLFEGGSVIKDERAAARMYLAAASQGHIEAMCAVGLCYYLGRGMCMDVSAGVKWLSNAAQLGHGIAQSALAYMYTALPFSSSSPPLLLPRRVPHRKRRYATTLCYRLLACPRLQCQHARLERV